MIASIHTEILEYAAALSIALAMTFGAAYALVQAHLVKPMTRDDVAPAMGSKWIYASNVDVIREMLDSLTAHRAYFTQLCLDFPVEIEVCGLRLVYCSAEEFDERVLRRIARELAEYDASREGA